MESNGEVQEDKETVSLLPSRRGGLSKKAGRPRLKVQWNDKDGNKLAEIVEFQPRYAYVLRSTTPLNFVIYFMSSTSTGSILRNMKHCPWSQELLGL
ncbi:hypothetical protein Acr_22g0001170 [Actinidia rufa]|uniref:Uncharacterized protein n=1 Tax=Actinidia rufa TaxID=165716 RepID=A0A7J0GIT2_9ERIC|nr:hypothetical protein Acr_22g0001170 [Actinidia rufa]